jgi:type III restriction enzyme
MELTLAVPCQALLILDADLPLDRLALVPEALAIATIPIDEPLGPVQRLDIHTFTQLHEELDKREWLCGRYIVLPNVSEGGTSTFLRSGMANKYKEMPCVGAYVDGLITQFGEGNARIVRGEDRNYGNKKVAVFQTSDNRTWAHTDLGSATTWVKWAMPSAEALRQACLADDTRLSQARPVLPTSFIAQLAVSNSQFLGPVDLELNQQYNAIIGGRGTGKSTILEYLRWALCDQPPAPAPEEDIGDQRLRRERLVRATLASIPDAQVEVHFVVNDLSHVVRRYAATGEVDLKVGDQSFRRVSEADVRSVIPIQAYSQKQLSSVSVRVDELTRFVTAPVQARLAEIDAELATVAGEIREAYARVQRERQLDVAIRRDELALESLREQATRLREGITGVSAGDRELLDQRVGYEAARQLVESFERTATRAQNETRALAELLGRLAEDVRGASSDGLPLSDRLSEMRSELERVLADGIASANASRDALEGLVSDGSTYASAREAWREDNGAFESEYEAASRRWTEHEQRIRELSSVEERLRSVADSLAGSKEQLRDLGDADGAYRELRARWVALRVEQMSVIDQQCAELTTLSDGMIERRSRQAQLFPTSGKH